MGVGTPVNIMEGVHRGIDLFELRNAEPQCAVTEPCLHGKVYVSCTMKNIRLIRSLWMSIAVAQYVAIIAELIFAICSVQTKF
jgi:hypothetical protein